MPASFRPAPRVSGSPSSAASTTFRHPRNRRAPRPRPRTRTGPTTTRSMARRRGRTRPSAHLRTCRRSAASMHGRLATRPSRRRRPRRYGHPSRSARCAAFVRDDSADAAWSSARWRRPHCSSCSAGPAAAAGAPDLSRATHFLATTTTAAGSAGTSLTHDGYYESFPGFGDFGLTIDGAFALAATGNDNATLGKVLAFLAHGQKDASGNSIATYTGIGTKFVSGGAIGKEAVLAEVTGNDPRTFGGHDLIAALDKTACTKTGCEQRLRGPGQLRLRDVDVLAGARDHRSTPSRRRDQRRARDRLPREPAESGGRVAEPAAALERRRRRRQHRDGRDGTGTATERRDRGCRGRRKPKRGSRASRLPTADSTAPVANPPTPRPWRYKAWASRARTTHRRSPRRLPFSAASRTPTVASTCPRAGRRAPTCAATTQVVSGLVGTSFGVLTDVVKVTPVDGPRDDDDDHDALVDDPDDSARVGPTGCDHAERRGNSGRRRERDAAAHRRGNDARIAMGRAGVLDRTGCNRNRSATGPPLTRAVRPPRTNERPALQSRERLETAEFSEIPAAGDEIPGRD